MSLISDNDQLISAYLLLCYLSFMYLFTSLLRCFLFPLLRFLLSLVHVVQKMT